MLVLVLDADPGDGGGIRSGLSNSPILMLGRRRSAGGATPAPPRDVDDKLDDDDEEEAELEHEGAGEAVMSVAGRWWRWW